MLVGEGGEEVQMRRRRREVKPVGEAFEPLRSTGTTLLARDSLTASLIKQDVEALIAAAFSARVG